MRELFPKGGRSTGDQRGHGPARKEHAVPNRTMPWTPFVGRVLLLYASEEEDDDEDDDEAGRLRTFFLVIRLLWTENTSAETRL